MSTIDFTGKVAVVTGAGRGLGRAYALEFARRGARVVVNDIGASVSGDGFSQAPAAEVVAEIEATGGVAIASFDDIAVPGNGGVIGRAVEAFGTVDILVNNAGRLEHHPFEDLPDESFLATQDVHLMGTFRTTRDAYRIMRARRCGRIVLTTSQVGFFGKPGSTAYGAAKMGVLGLLATLKLEAPQYGIQVNAISPFAGTRMSAGAFPESVMPLIAPEQVAAAVMVLCSEGFERSGDILIAGGGHYSAAWTVETAGIDLDFDAITAEALAERYSEIVDSHRTHRFGDALEAVGTTFERIMKHAE